MPRNGSGVATAVPGTDDMVPSTTIQSSVQDSLVADIYSLFNTAWPVSLGGTGGSATVAWKAPDGTLALPGIAFGLDTDTGFYRNGSGSVILVSNGVEIGRFNGGGNGITAVDQFTTNAGKFVTIGGQMTTGNGTAAVPSFSFSNFATDGFYSIAASNVGLTLAGVKSWDYASSSTTYQWVDAGATVGPTLDLYRDSASPAASDILGKLIFNGRDSAANKQEYAEITAQIDDPTSTSEDSSLVFKTMLAGAVTTYLALGQNAAGTATPNAVGLPLGQLSFPATQNASANANTLDDYEEGTFTITVAFATAGTSSWAYGAQVGTDTKIGDTAVVSMNFSATPTIGTGSGVMTLSGFPFTGIATTQYASVSEMGVNWTWPAGRTQVNLRLNSSASTMLLQGSGTGVATVSFQASNMATGQVHGIQATGVYIVT